MGTIAEVPGLTTEFLNDQESQCFDGSLVDTDEIDIDQSSSQPVSAILGINNGSVTIEGESYYFTQTVSSDVSYLYSLVGPMYTDFDLEIFDSYNFSIAEAVGATYPDITYISGISGLITIVVTAYSGTGDFTLEISETNDIGGSATLGINSGYIGYDETVVLTFSATVGQWYEFILNGPEGTDFDFNVYDDYYDLIASGESYMYPEYDFAEATTTSLEIEIYAYDGSGEYSLTINEISEPNLNPDLIFSNEITSGDTHYWYIDESKGFQDDVGDTFILTLLSNGPNIDLTFNDYLTGTGLSTHFRFTYQGKNALGEWDLFMFLLPVEFEIFENEPLGVFELAYLLFKGEVTQSGNTVSVYYSDGWSLTFSISYDSITGLMQSMTLQDLSDNSYARILYTHDKSEIPDTLPFSPLTSIVLTLFVIPLIKKRKIKRQLN